MLKSNKVRGGCYPLKGSAGRAVVLFYFLTNFPTQDVQLCAICSSTLINIWHSGKQSPRWALNTGIISDTATDAQTDIWLKWIVHKNKQWSRQRLLASHTKRLFVLRGNNSHGCRSAGTCKCQWIFTRRLQDISRGKRNERSFSVNHWSESNSFLIKYFFHFLSAFPLFVFWRCMLFTNNGGFEGL